MLKTQKEEIERYEKQVAALLELVPRAISSLDGRVLQKPIDEYNALIVHSIGYIHGEIKVVAPIRCGLEDLSVPRARRPKHHCRFERLHCAIVYFESIVIVMKASGFHENFHCLMKCDVDLRKTLHAMSCCTSERQPNFLW